MKTFEIENNDKDVENQPLINRSSSNERNNNANSASANSSSPANVPVDPHAARNRYLKLIFCFAGLQCSYVLWGITQEDLMTTVYSFGKFTSSSFCVFGNRILALIVSFSIVMYRKYASISEVKDVPYYYYAPASLSNTLSSWAQYEALKYISFPVQVLSKSCKVIPVMLVSYSSIFPCN
jgi:adenosine 3'-phospho 5'-phosphosulfate transporter B2